MVYFIRSPKDRTRVAPQMKFESSPTPPVLVIVR